MALLLTALPGDGGVKALGARTEEMDFISNQYRHGKTIQALGASKTLIEQTASRRRLQAAAQIRVS